MRRTVSAGEITERDTDDLSAVRESCHGTAAATESETMNRRGFFSALGATAGAALVTTTPMRTPEPPKVSLDFRGVDAPTALLIGEVVGAIDRTSFSLWRNQQMQ